MPTYKNREKQKILSFERLEPEFGIFCLVSNFLGINCTSSPNCNVQKQTINRGKNKENCTHTLTLTQKALGCVLKEESKKRGLQQN